MSTTETVIAESVNSSGEWATVTEGGCAGHAVFLVSVPKLDGDGALSVVYLDRDLALAHYRVEILRQVHEVEQLAGDDPHYDDDVVNPWPITDIETGWASTHRPRSDFAAA